MKRTPLHDYQRNRLGDADTMRALLSHEPLDAADRHNVRAFIGIELPMDPEPRQCYVVLQTQRDQHGYIPSLVTEGQPGHAPTPWHWGDTFEEAETVCAAVNARRGIDADAADEIKLSSRPYSINIFDNGSPEQCFQCSAPSAYCHDGVYACHACAAECF
jgi:hypothetical protein